MKRGVVLFSLLIAGCPSDQGDERFPPPPANQEAAADLDRVHIEASLPLASIIGVSARFELRVKNESEAPVRLSSLESRIPQLYVFLNESVDVPGRTELVVEAEQVGTYTVPIEGPFEGVIVAQTDVGSIEVAIHGSIVPCPDLSMPAAFGWGPLGTQVTRTATLSNRTERDWSFTIETTLDDEALPVTTGVIPRGSQVLLPVRATIPEDFAILALVASVDGCATSHARASVSSRDLAMIRDRVFANHSDESVFIERLEVVEGEGLVDDANALRPLRIRPKSTLFVPFYWSRASTILVHYRALTGSRPPLVLHWE